MSARLLSSVLLLLIAINDVQSAACDFQQDNMYVLYGLKEGTVFFRVTLTGANNRNFWNAIGFGRSMQSGIDVMVIRVQNGRATVSDEYVQGFTQPDQDPSNDVTVTKVAYNDNSIVISFRRPQFTRDTQYDAQLSGCQVWQFATGNNMLMPNGGVTHHRRTPVSRMVCIEQCRL